MAEAPQTPIRGEDAVRQRSDGSIHVKPVHDGESWFPGAPQRKKWVSVQQLTKHVRMWCGGINPSGERTPNLKTFDPEGMQRPTIGMLTRPRAGSLFKAGATDEAGA